MAYPFTYEWWTGLNSWLEAAWQGTVSQANEGALVGALQKDLRRAGASDAETASAVAQMKKDLYAHNEPNTIPSQLGAALSKTAKDLVGGVFDGATNGLDAFSRFEDETGVPSWLIWVGLGAILLAVLLKNR